MTCIFCQGNMVAGTTTDFTDLGTCIVIIKNVPCSKCDQCGEKVYTGTTYARLESIVDTLRNSLTEIAVINYSDTAA